MELEQGGHRKALQTVKYSAHVGVPVASPEPVGTHCSPGQGPGGTPSCASPPWPQGPHLGQQEQGAAGAGVRVALPQVEELGRHDGGREEAQAQKAGDGDERYILQGCGRARAGVPQAWAPGSPLPLGSVPDPPRDTASLILPSAPWFLHRSSPAAPAQSNPAQSSPAGGGRTSCWAPGNRSRTRRKSWRKVARTTAGHARTERLSALSSAPRWARSVCALCSNTSASV